MATSSYDLFQVCQIMQYIQFHNTPMAKAQNALLNMYTYSRTWSPNHCCERKGRMSSLL